MSGPGLEALDMLKAWNTGHPGGVATVHANSAISALYRIEQLCQEAVVTVPRQLIAEAIDLVVFIAGRGVDRRVSTIARVAGLDPDTGTYTLADLSPINPKEIRERLRPVIRTAVATRTVSGSIFLSHARSIISAPVLARRARARTPDRSRGRPTTSRGSIR